MKTGVGVLLIQSFAGASYFQINPEAANYIWKGNYKNLQP